MTPISITYTTSGGKKKHDITLPLADDIAYSVLKHQEESIFVKRSCGGQISELLDMLARLQGHYGGAKFEDAKEVR